MLAHQTKQVTFLLPKIGTQNETLDSDIEEGCRESLYLSASLKLFATFGHSETLQFNEGLGNEIHIAGMPLVKPQ